ncbi:hypothetical protein DCAR_0521228 [Daucus carota subsp. sativus]|uniref:DNA/RNA-binding protein Alba-like domain-containing protein n=1 Tax=Daucus carota subsp. sativus TaxID=79200 RepID=A0AAF0X7E7_DAUCS|nr:hypothetical protein DCAR_0521228 [Daucus carota subsp. sativus]
MDRYRKVQNPKAESAITENEIRITSKGLVRNYISYATSLLQEGNGNEIVLKAMGQAINKTVSITEIIKRRMPQLHQDTVISSVSIVDVWEPIEEGLLPVETSRNVSVISITLSTKELNKNSPGYQAPLNAEQAKQQPQSRPQRNYHQQQQGPTNNYQQQARGRGRGRGWSRGGYGSYEGNYRGNYQGNYQENYQETGNFRNRGQGGGRDGGYNHARGRGGGRGRGGYGRGRGRGRMGNYARDDINQE